MEKGRRKVHICLIGIVLTAVVIGLCYYCISADQKMEESGGALVKKECEADYGC